MKTSFVHSLQYLDIAEKGLQPRHRSRRRCSNPEVGERSVQAGIELFEMADECGFDWVSITEHHYSPRQLTPNPLLLAGALCKRVRHAKIAILGSTIPLLTRSGGRGIAMLDLLSGGRLIVGLLRGTAPNTSPTAPTRPSRASATRRASS